MPFELLLPIKPTNRYTKFHEKVTKKAGTYTKTGFALNIFQVLL